MDTQKALKLSDESSWVKTLRSLEIWSLTVNSLETVELKHSKIKFIESRSLNLRIGEHNEQ